MPKLSLNQAAKRAGVAKATLLERLNSNDVDKKMTAARNERGHWQIDESELFRVFPKPQEGQGSESGKLPPENREKTSSNSALETEVRMLREQIDRMDTERSRECDQLTEQIEDLRGRLDAAQEQEKRLTQLIEDKRPKAPQRGLWARLVG